MHCCHKLKGALVQRQKEGHLFMCRAFLVNNITFQFLYLQYKYDISGLEYEIFLIWQSTVKKKTGIALTRKTYTTQLLFTVCIQYKQILQNYQISITLILLSGKKAKTSLQFLVSVRVTSDPCVSICIYLLFCCYGMRSNCS